GPNTEKLVSVSARIRSIASTVGSGTRIATSDRDKNASSSVSVKFDVATTRRCGWAAALSSKAVSTASVALCTSAGFADNDAALPATVIDSTSSSTTTVGRQSSASDGTYSDNNSETRCWDCPCSALISPCGLTSISRTRFPVTYGVSSAASPRASVV